MNATTKATKLVTEVTALLETTIDKVPNIFYALGIRQPCGRCGGSGSFSYCQRYGSTCFDCRGSGAQPAKLTEATLATARAKVEAGELAALRKAAANKAEARRALAPLFAVARDVYDTIANQYEAAYKVSRADWPNNTPIPFALHRAQEMNNSLFWGHRAGGAGIKSWGSTDLVSAVQDGKRRDYLQVKADLETVIADLETLRAAWLAFAAEKSS